MRNIIKLNAANLNKMPEDVARPGYDRTKIRAGIVHIGIGSFHRSHQAYYTDLLLNSSGVTDWGICGVALLDTDCTIYDTIVKQDGLYTLMITEPDGRMNAKIIGSIVEWHFAPDNPLAVIEKMAARDIRIITLTITEGGYNFDAVTGEFLIDEPSVQWDLKYPEKPVTVFGYLTQALKRRRDSNTPGLTIQSCDNIQENGDILKKMLLSYVSRAEPGLADWIEKEVAFPNSMVDRITPATKHSDIENLRSAFGIEDGWPVVCETFIQWVSEDKYSNGRPDWESAGVQFVNDVRPFEKMKIRLLNAGHSLLGFTGTLCGCKTIDESVRVPFLRTLLQEFLDLEVTPVLGTIEGINIEVYKESLIERFANPNIKDQLSRICSSSSAKIPKFLLPTINEELERGGPVKRGALVIAAWCRYLELAGSPDHDIVIQDQMGSILREKAIESAGGDPLAFLKIEPVFGSLAQSVRFADTYRPIIDGIRRDGIERVIERLGEGAT